MRAHRGRAAGAPRARRGVISILLRMVFRHGVYIKNGTQVLPMQGNNFQKNTFITLKTL
jgi:hypothetical protein